MKKPRKATQADLNKRMPRNRKTNELYRTALEEMEHDEQLLDLKKELAGTRRLTADDYNIRINI